MGYILSGTLLMGAEGHRWFRLRNPGFPQWVSSSCPAVPIPGLSSEGWTASEQHGASLWSMGDLGIQDSTRHEPFTGLRHQLDRNWVQRVLNHTPSRVECDIYMFSRDSGFRSLEGLIQAEGSLPLFLCVSVSLSPLISLSLSLPLSVSLSISVSLPAPSLCLVSTLGSLSRSLGVAQHWGWIHHYRTR